MCFRRAHDHSYEPVPPGIINDLVYLMSGHIERREKQRVQAWRDERLGSQAAPEADVEPLQGDLAAVLQAMEKRLDELAANVRKLLAAGPSVEASPRDDGLAKRTLSTREAAERLHLSRAHVYRLIKEKRIPYIRVGRQVFFDSTKIDAWLAEREIPAVPRARRRER
jgi:excisionase family DNA binding protein